MHQIEQNPNCWVTNNFRSLIQSHFPKLGALSLKEMALASEHRANQDRFRVHLFQPNSDFYSGLPALLWNNHEKNLTLGWFVYNRKA